MRDFIDILVPILIGFLMIPIFIVIFILLPLYLIDKSGCYKKAELYKYETTYNLTTGCLIKVNGEYLPMENFENIYKNGYNLNVKEK